jgi:hypothetical protein
MLKLYCDKCEKEIIGNYRYSISKTNHSNKFVLCENCWNEWVKLENNFWSEKNV